jgi:hypothetical protein
MPERLEANDRSRENDPMTHDEHLEEYLAICQAVFERMKRDSTWPWPVDSTLLEDVIDSDSQSRI